MVKNKSQLGRCLKGIRANSKEDETSIVDYCKKKLGISVRMGTGKNLPIITFLEFKQWISQGFLECGDVVIEAKKKLVGIVYKTGYQNMSVLTYANSDGVWTRQLLTVLRTDYRLATLEEILPIQRILCEKGLSWDRKKNRIVKREYVPKNNQPIRLSVLGRKLGCGVFKEIDGKGRIVMYCVKMENENARFSLHEVVGPATDYQIDPLNTYDRKFFVEELAKCGVSWNGHLRHVERIHYRVPKGQTYYYLNDMFEIVKAPDLYRTRDYKRIAVGNYFINESGAERFRGMLLEEATKGRVIVINGKSRVNELKAMGKK